MKLDETTLMEIEDYIKHLDKTVGLKSETVLDVYVCIKAYRRKLIEDSNLNINNNMARCIAAEQQVNKSSSRER